MSDNYDRVESDIRRHEFQKRRLSYIRKEPAGFCETCGKPVYARDMNGVPYRQCYKCHMMI